MKFAVVKTDPDPRLGTHVAAIAAECCRQGHRLVDKEARHTFVLNATDLEHPAVHRRRSRNEFVVSIGLLDPDTADIRAVCYAALVRTLSNLLFGIMPPEHGGAPQVYCVTPEVGFVAYPFEPKKIYQTMLPIIGSHFVLRNRISADLPLANELDAPEVSELIRYGRVLDRLGLLPTPFPLEDILSRELKEHVFRIFEISGLSYGNLSVRGSVPGISGTTFWMTARGVDKAHLQGIGRDIVLVTGYDPASSEMLVSTPPDHEPRIRASVDAVEHFLIYRAFPAVGAIVHVHAWMDGVACTEQTYPCGTRELAEEVVRLLECSGRPGRAVVGLKNHGLTITGPDLKEIFARMEGKLQVTVPMFE